MTLIFRTIKNTFHKEERLSSRKGIDVLFDQGEAFSAYPLKLIYMHSAVPQDFPAQAMFVVPKRNFKRAHDRNLLKRRLREAYRLQKNDVYTVLSAHDKTWRMAWIYTGRKIETYAVVETALKKLMAKATATLQK